MKRRRRSGAPSRASGPESPRRRSSGSATTCRCIGSPMRCRSVCAALTARRAARGTLPDGWVFRLAHRGPVGIRLPRRFHRRHGLRSACSPTPTPTSLTPPATAAGRPSLGRVGASRALPRQCVGTARHARQHLRVVPRLVPRAVAWRRRSGSLHDTWRPQSRRHLLPCPARRCLERRAPLLPIGLAPPLRARAILGPHRISRRATSCLMPNRAHA